MIVGLIILLGDSIGQPVNGEPFLYNNYDDARKALFNKCVDWNMPQLTISHAVWIEKHESAKFQCDLQFIDEDNKSGKYDYPPSPLQGLQNSQYIECTRNPTTTYEECRQLLD